VGSFVGRAACFERSPLADDGCVLPQGWRWVDLDDTVLALASSQGPWAQEPGRCDAHAIDAFEGLWASWVLSTHDTGRGIPILCDCSA
jgi:hypothetical protein